MAENIGKILQSKTTATQIIADQTVWINESKITGTMVDRGTLNWSPTSSITYNVRAGYYNGVTLNSSGAYNAEVIVSDNRVNVNSVNYKTRYNNGYNKELSDSAITGYKMYHWLGYDDTKSVTLNCFVGDLIYFNWQKNAHNGLTSISVTSVSCGNIITQESYTNNWLQFVQ